ncbi:hypothetical protein ACFP53_23055, partial [Streptomyces zhihengii]
EGLKDTTSGSHQRSRRTHRTYEKISSGSDNVGKTTYLARLASLWDGFQPLGAVHEHARAVGDYARWWFETSTTVELTEMLLASLLATAPAVPGGPYRANPDRSRQGVSHGRSLPGSGSLAEALRS